MWLIIGNAADHTADDSCCSMNFDIRIFTDRLRTFVVYDEFFTGNIRWNTRDRKERVALLFYNRYSYSMLWKMCVTIKFANRERFANKNTSMNVLKFSWFYSIYQWYKHADSIPCIFIPLSLLHVYKKKIVLWYKNL